RPRARPPPGMMAPKGSAMGGTSGHIQLGTIHGEQPTPEKESPRRPDGGERLTDPAEQGHDATHAKAVARLAEGAGTYQRPHGAPYPAARQVQKDGRQRLVGVEVDESTEQPHEARGQLAVAKTVPAGDDGKRGIEDCWGEHLPNGACTQVI